MFGNGVSIADIAAVMGNRDGNGYGGFGEGWWAIIILFFLFGWGGEGGMFGGMNRGSSTQAEVQRGFDTQAILSKLDGISNGICSLGYDQLAQMNGINSNIMQTGFGITNAIQAGQIANMQQFNAAATQLQTCCCNIENGQARAEYNRAADTCAIETLVNQVGQNIMTNCNNNYRQIHDEIIDLRMQDKDQQIAALTAKLAACDQQNMINAQTTQLENYLRPPVNPCFVVPNPYAFYGYAGYNNGNGGCCCNGNNGFGF